MSKDIFFELDQAGKEGRLSIAFEIAHQIFSQGKDLYHFVENLSEHFRSILLIKLCGSKAAFLSLSEKEKQRYEASAKFYTQEQCLTILDFLMEAQSNIRFQSSGRIALEALLMRIMRTHQRLPVEILVKRLVELEQTVLAIGPTNLEVSSPSSPISASMQPLCLDSPPTPTSSPTQDPVDNPKEVSQRTLQSSNPHPLSSVSEDPTPSAADLGRKTKTEIPQTPLIAEVTLLANSASLLLKENQSMKSETAFLQSSIKHAPPSEDRFLKKSDNLFSSPNSISPPSREMSKQSHYDTLLQFAAVELEGTIQKKPIQVL